MKVVLVLLFAILVGYASAQCITCGGSIPAEMVLNGAGVIGNGYPAFVYIPGDSLNKHCMVCQTGTYNICELVPTASVGNGCNGTVCDYSAGWSTTYIVHPGCPDTTNCGTGICPSSCTGSQCKAQNNVTYSYPAYADVLCHCGSKREEPAAPVEPKQVAQVCPNGYLNAPLYVGWGNISAPVGNCPNYTNSPWNLHGFNNPPCALCQQGSYTSRTQFNWTSQQYPCSTCHKATLKNGTTACITHVSSDIYCYCSSPPSPAQKNFPTPPANATVGEPIAPGCGLRDAQKRNATCRREGEHGHDTAGGNASSQMLEGRQSPYNGNICANWYPSATVSCIANGFNGNYRLATAADCDDGNALSPTDVCGGHECLGVAC